MAPRTALLFLLVVSVTAVNVLWTQNELKERSAVTAPTLDTPSPSNPVLPAPAGDTDQERELKRLEERVNYLETQNQALQQENSTLVDKLAAIGIKEKVLSATMGKTAAVENTPAVTDEKDNVTLGLELLKFRQLDDTPVATVESSQAEVEKLILASLEKRWGKDFGQREGAAFAALGLIPEAVDTLPLRAALLVRQITGWYDEETGTLHVVNAKLAQEGQLIPADAVLAVAYGALQHRYSRTLYAKPLSTDERLAHEALIAGDASLTRFLYRLQHPAPPSPLDDFPADDPDHPLNQIVAPAFLRDLMLFPLNSGFQFAQAMHSIGSWQQLNAAYTRLPACSAEILSDEVYLADHTLPAPQIKWPSSKIQDRSAFWDDCLGQHAIYLMLRRYNEAELAGKVSQSWRADRWFAFASEGSSPTRGDALWQSQWASPEAATAFHSAMAEWLRQHYATELPPDESSYAFTAMERHLKLVVQKDQVYFVDASTATFASAALQHLQSSPP
jgi:hypothetical protein